MIVTCQRVMLKTCFYFEHCLGFFLDKTTSTRRNKNLVFGSGKRSEIFAKSFRPNGRRRPRFRGQSPEWLFKGKPPTENQNFWHYWDENDCHITISPDQRFNAPKADSERLTGPKKRRTDQRPQTHVVETQIPATDLDVNSSQESEPPNEDRERSPRRNAPNRDSNKTTQGPRPTWRHPHGPRLFSWVEDSWPRWIRRLCLS